MKIFSSYIEPIASLPDSCPDELRDYFKERVRTESVFHALEGIFTRIAHEIAEGRLPNSFSIDPKYEQDFVDSRFVAEIKK